MRSPERLRKRVKNRVDADKRREQAECQHRARHSVTEPRNHQARGGQAPVHNSRSNCGAEAEPGELFELTQLRESVRNAFEELENRTRAAELLDLSVRALSYKIHDYKLE